MIQQLNNTSQSNTSYQKKKSGIEQTTNDKQQMNKAEKQL